MKTHTFLENENDILKTLANDAVYQFTVVFEREVARAKAAQKERFGLIDVDSN
jgi:hypothetical protein